MVRTNKSSSHSHSERGDFIGKGMILCCVVLLLAIAIPALMTSDGVSGDNDFKTDGGIEYRIDADNNILTIKPASSPESGYTSGQMKDYEAASPNWITSAPWGTIYDQNYTLKIKSGVTKISDYAFSGCTGFTGTLSIPEGVTSIGLRAFLH